jgi:isopentenyldiphosphate isomerase
MYMKERMETKPYLREMSSKPNQLWFKAKRFGWGWYPCTWQGWAILAMFLFVIVRGVMWIDAHALTPKEFLIDFLPQTYILTVFMIIICYATGEKPTWRWGRKHEESFDVLDESGAHTGEVATRTEVHEKGLWHRAAHVYIVNSKDEVLLQCRAAHNMFRPGRWYLSAGGHLHTGETSLATAARETQEELGLSIPESEFKLAGSATKQHILLYGTYINNEIDDIYVVHRDIELSKLKKHGEIADIQWVPVETFKHGIEGKDPAFVNYEGLPVLFEYLEQHGR